jgi:predicted ATPase
MVSFFIAAEIIFIAAEIIRLRALFSARDADEKLALLQTSLAMATAQGVKLCQLRAATNLAELLLNLRNESAAHALLEPICGSFTEGANMRHLISARTLLAALGK